MLKDEYYPTDERYKGFFSRLLGHNDLLLMFSAGIFLSSIFIGYFFAGGLENIMGAILKQLKESVAKGEIKITTISIFTNNLKVAFLTYAGGILVGTYTSISLFINGAFIGYAASKFSFGDFVVFTLPHGVFEIIGVIFAGAAGFRLANFIIKFLKGVLDIKAGIPVKKQLKYNIEFNADEFKESFSLFIIAVVLLIIAAFIEANITPLWINYVKGL
jgi:stage II sporulation protein M